MKTTTIYGYENNRYFVPANNPFGHRVWFPTRKERDAAVARLTERAARKGLSGAASAFAPVKLVIRSADQWDWLDSLKASEAMDAGR